MPQKHPVLRGADRFITRPVPLCRAARLLALFLWVARQQWAALSFNLWLIVENHVQQEGPEQRADTVWYRGRDERPRQPRAQLPPRWNGAPSQDLLVIRRNHQTGEVSLDPLRWGLIPYWCEDPKGGVPVAEALRQVAPRCAGSHQPKHRVEHAAMIAWRPAAAAMDQERFEVRPLIVGHQSANQGCPPQRAALNQFAILASIGLSKQTHLGVAAFT
jgi:hypothetical protein